MRIAEVPPETNDGRTPLLELRNLSTSSSPATPACSRNEQEQKPQEQQQNNGMNEQNAAEAQQPQQQQKRGRKSRQPNESKVLRDLTSAIMCLFLFYMALTLLSTAVSLKFIIECRQLLAPCSQQSSMNPCWQTIAPIVINCATFIVMFCSCCCSSPRWLSAILWLSATINGAFAIVLMIPDPDALTALQDLISSYYANAFYSACDTPLDRYRFGNRHLEPLDQDKLRDNEQICSKCLSMVNSNVDSCEDKSVGLFRIYCERMPRNEFVYLEAAIASQLASAGAPSNASATALRLSSDASRAVELIRSPFSSCLRNLRDFAVTHYAHVNLGTSLILLVSALVNMPIGVYMWRLAARHGKLKQVAFDRRRNRGPLHAVLSRIMPLFQALHTDAV